MSEEACSSFRRSLLQLPGPVAATLLTSVGVCCVCCVCRCSGAPLHVREQACRHPFQLCPCVLSCSQLQPAGRLQRWLVGWLAGHSQLQVGGGAATLCEEPAGRVITVESLVGRVELQPWSLSTEWQLAGKLNSQPLNAPVRRVQKLQWPSPGAWGNTYGSDSNWPAPWALQQSLPCLLRASPSWAGGGAWKGVADLVLMDMHVHV